MAGRGSNEVEIVVKSKDKTGAGYDDAKKRARKFGKDVEREVSDAGERAGKGLTDNIGEGFGQLTDKLPLLGLGAGGAAGAALVEGLTEAMDVEAANDKLAAQLGLTEQESARVGTLAGELFADNYGEGMADVNAAIKGVAHNITDLGEVSDTELKGMAANALTVATILDEDVGAVTRSVGKLLKTGLAKNAQEAFDIITRGAQTGANEAGDLLDTLDEYSTQFRSLGLTGPQAMGLISQALRGGARDADVAADTIKEFAIEAVAGGQRVRGGFKHLELDADEMVKKFAEGGPKAAKAFDLVLDRLRGIEDPAKRNAIAIELFGTKAEDMAGALNAMDLSKATKQLGDLEGATKTAGDTMSDNAQARVDKFWKTMKGDFVTALGEYAIPAIEDTVAWFDNMGDASDNANDSVAESGAGIAASMVTMDSSVQATVGAMGVKLGAKFENIKASAIAKAGTLVQGVGTRFSQLPGRASAALGALSVRVATRFENAKARALAIVGALGSQLFAAGGRLIDRLAAGLQSRIPSLSTIVAGIAGMIRRNFPASPAKEGPLSGQGDPLISGGKIADRLAAGIAGRRARVAGAMGGLLAGSASTRWSPTGAASTGGGVAALAGGEPLVLRIESGGSRLDDLLVELLRKAVRARGGDVQVVLGT